MSCLTERTLKRLELLLPRCKKYNDYPHSIHTEEREELAMMFAATFTVNCTR